jgi:hypothetical protein
MSCLRGRGGGGMRPWRYMGWGVRGIGLNWDEMVQLQRIALIMIILVYRVLLGVYRFMSLYYDHERRFEVIAMYRMYLSITVSQNTTE